MVFYQISKRAYSDYQSELAQWEKAYGSTADSRSVKAKLQNYQQEQAEKKQQRKLLSTFLLLFSIVSFATIGGILSGILFLLTAVFVNPLMTGFIRNKGKRLPIWLLIIVLIVGFLAGVLTYPTEGESDQVVAQSMEADS